MKKQKMLVTFLVCAIITSSLLAGCKPKTNTSTNTASTTALKQVTLTWYFPGTVQKDQDRIQTEASNYVKSKINAKIELHVLDFSNWTQKINTMLAANEPADLLFTGGWGGYVQNATSGGYIELTDSLLTKYAPHLKDILGPARIQGAKVNGKLYAIATVKEMAANNGVVVDGDMVKKYNMDLSKVKSAADLEPLLAIIKKNEPDMVPFFVTPYGGAVAFADRASGLIQVSGDNSGGNFDPKTGKVLNPFEQQYFLDGAAMAQKWHDAGYVNKDAGLAGSKEPTKFFSEFMGLKPGKDVELNNATGKHWIQVDFDKPIIDTGSTTNSMIAISKTSQNPERSLMLLDLLNTDKTLNNLINYGDEGKDYVFTDKAKGVIAFPQGVDGTNATYNPGANWMFQNQFLNYIRSNEDPQKWEKFKTYNDNAIKSPLLGFVIDASKIQSESAAVSNVVNQYYSVLDAGIGDWKAHQKEFVAKLKAAGQDQLIAESQKQIDAFLKNK